MVRKSLKTKDELTATQRAIPLVQEYKKQFEQARLPTKVKLEAELKEKQLEVRRIQKQLNMKSISDQEYEQLLDEKDILEDEVQSQILDSYNVDDASELTTGELREAKSAYQLATGRKDNFAGLDNSITYYGMMPCFSLHWVIVDDNPKNVVQKLQNLF